MGCTMRANASGVNDSTLVRERDTRLEARA